MHFGECMCEYGVGWGWGWGRLKAAVSVHVKLVVVAHPCPAGQDRSRSAGSVECVCVCNKDVFCLEGWVQCRYCRRQMCRWARDTGAEEVCVPGGVGVVEAGGGCADAC